MSLSKVTGFLKGNWKSVVLSTAALAGVLLALRARKKQNKLIEVKKSHKLVGVQRKFTEKPYDTNETIYLRDKEALIEKIYKLKAAGVDELQIILDFDQTITPFFVEGVPCPSCFDIFKQEGIATPEYIEQSRKLREFYYPIEIDPTIPSEDKIRYMEEWWEKAEKILIESKISQESLKNALEKVNIAVRHGFRNLVKTCELAQMPIYIVSGGIVDMIGTILRSFIEDLETNDLIKIVANIMEFDSEGLFTGFSRPHIHSLHKEKILDKNNPNYKFRKNAILVGDALQDRLMSRNTGCDLVLAIGFLSDKNKESLPYYLEAYDIVIAGDGNFTQVEAVLREIINIPQRSQTKNLLRDSNSPLKEVITIEDN